MKLTKTELNKFREIYERYVSIKLTDEELEDVFVYFIRLVSLIK